MRLETVQVESDNEWGFVVKNKSDFDADHDVLYGESSKQQSDDDASDGGNVDDKVDTPAKTKRKKRSKSSEDQS